MKTPVAIDTRDMYVEISTTRPCCGVRGVGVLVGANVGVRRWGRAATHEIPPRGGRAMALIASHGRSARTW